MEQEIKITFKTSKLIKEKNIKINTLCSYDKKGYFTKLPYTSNKSGKYPICSQSKLQNILIEEYKIKPLVDLNELTGYFTWKVYKWNFDNRIGKHERISRPESFNTYKESLEEALYKALELI